MEGITKGQVPTSQYVPVDDSRLRRTPPLSSAAAPRRPAKVWAHGTLGHLAVPFLIVIEAVFLDQGHMPAIWVVGEQHGQH